MLVKDLIDKLKRINENDEVVIVDNYDNVFSKIEVLIAKNRQDKTNELAVICVDF
jgi:hypothetical protein|nr:MAG TPA: acetolactate synthase isozyme 1 small subunit [Caudoviricetes sp.]